MSRKDFEQGRTFFKKNLFSEKVVLFRDLRTAGEIRLKHSANFAMRDKIN